MHDEEAMLTSTIEKCKACSSPGTIMTYRVGFKSYHAYILCPYCGVEGPDCFDLRRLDATRLAISAWNERQRADVPGRVEGK